MTVPETDTAPTVPFYLLTKDDCPNCERLKLMLEKPLKGKYASEIEVVHQESNEAMFAELVEAHTIRSTPALIRTADGKVCTATGLGEVQRFMEGQA